MKLTTRCPRCQTVFQASLADLQLRKGYVRCVECAYIFDGYAEVTSDDTPSLAGPAAVAATRPEPSPTTELESKGDRAGGPAPGAEPSIGRALDLAPEPFSIQEPSISLDALPVLDDEAPHVFRSGRHAGPARPVDDTGSDPAGVFHDIPDPADDTPRVFRSAREPGLGERPAPFMLEPRGGHAGGGTAAALLRAREEDLASSGLLGGLARLLLALLLLALVVQAAYVWRAQLAQTLPVLRPWLERACAPLHCTVPYARQLTRAAIVSSSLKTVDTGSPSEADQADPSDASTPTESLGPDPAVEERHYVLNLTLRNSTDQPQTWPVLVLSLNDSAGTLVVRRNLDPADYLPKALQGAPFAAGQDARLEVPLTLKGLRANGFQLDLFYP